MSSSLLVPISVLFFHLLLLPQLEPMITQGSGDCYEWDDDWTVSTVDGGLAAQFEHTVLITESGVEILTLLD